MHQNAEGLSVASKSIRSFSIIGLTALSLTASVSTAFALDPIADAALFTVKTTTAVEYPFGSDRKTTGRGAGFLIDRERGWILTNAHVAKR